MNSEPAAADHLEVEVKFLVADLAGIRDRVIEAGGML